MLIFTANFHCVDLEQALEQEVVTSLPSKSCLPTILYDVSLPTHPTHPTLFYNVETLLYIYPSVLRSLLQEFRQQKVLFLLRNSLY